MLTALTLALFLVLQSAPAKDAAKPVSPILLTAVEAQPLRDAFTSEQIADLAKAKAIAERQAAFYKFCAEHGLKPAEWEIRPDRMGGYVAVYVAVKIEKKGDKQE